MAIKSFVRRLARLWRHRWAEGDMARLFPADSLQALERMVADAELQHTGQVRLCIEAGLPMSYLWRDASARERAIGLFGKLRVWDTEHNNGVLIYLLLADHAIEMVADRALHRTLTEERWQALVSDMQSAFAGGHHAQGLSAAVERVSLQLQTHFPRDAHSPPAQPGLPDAPVVLGRGGATRI